MKKHRRHPKLKPGQLLAYYGRFAGNDGWDLQLNWGGSGATKGDGGLLSHALSGTAVFEGRSLIDELKRRGYDLETLRFSVKKMKCSQAQCDLPRKDGFAYCASCCVRFTPDGAEAPFDPNKRATEEEQAKYFANFVTLPPAPPLVRKCERCGITLMPDHPAVYCTNECAAADA